MPVFIQYDDPALLMNLAAGTSDARAIPQITAAGQVQQQARFEQQRINNQNSQFGQDQAYKYAALGQQADLRKQHDASVTDDENIKFDQQTSRDAAMHGYHQEDINALNQGRANIADANNQAKQQAQYIRNMGADERLDKTLDFKMQSGDAGASTEERRYQDSVRRNHDSSQADLQRQMSAEKYQATMESNAAMQHGDLDAANAAMTQHGQNIAGIQGQMKQNQDAFEKWLMTRPQPQSRAPIPQGAPQPIPGQQIPVGVASPQAMATNGAMPPGAQPAPQSAPPPATQAAPAANLKPLSAGDQRASQVYADVKRDLAGSPPEVIKAEVARRLAAMGYDTSSL